MSLASTSLLLGIEAAVSSKLARALGFLAGGGRAETQAECMREKKREVAEA